MRKARFTVFGMAVLALIAGFHVAASADEHEKGEKSLAISDLPPAVQHTLHTHGADGKVLEVEKEVEDGKTIYEADVVIHGRTWEIEIAPNGKLIKKELDDDEDEGEDDRDDDDDRAGYKKDDGDKDGEKKRDRRKGDKEKDDGDEDENEATVALNVVPFAVQKTLLAHAAGGMISVIEVEIENGKIVFEAEVVIHGRTWEIEIAQNGKLLEKELDDDEDGDDDKKRKGDEEEDEATVALNVVPVAVQHAILAHAAGGKISEVEIEIEDGMPVYEAQVIVRGQAWEIEIAQDGTVIEKEKGDDAGEDNDDDDDDDDDDDE